MSLNPLFHQMPPQMRTRYARPDTACRAIWKSHNRFSSTSRMFVEQMETNPESLAQPCLRLLNAALHHRGYLNTTSPGCLPERRPSKDRGLPSPHPGCFAAQSLLRVLSTTTDKLVWRYFAAWIRTVRPGLAPPNTPSPSNAKTSALVKFIRARPASFVQIVLTDLKSKRMIEVYD